MYYNRNDILERKKKMIDFDEEIKKFKPSLEVDQAEETIYNSNNITDMTDIMLEMMKDLSKTKQQR